MKNAIDEHLSEIEVRRKRIKTTVVKLIATDVVGIAIAGLSIPFVPLSINAEYYRALVIYVLSLVLVFFLIPSFIRPLGREERAFEQIVSAIKLLEKSSGKIVVEEADKHVSKAYKLLKGLTHGHRSWYREINREVTRLVDNIGSIIVPRLKSKELEVADLREIAFALAEPTMENIKNANDKLQKKYARKEIPESDLQQYASRFLEGRVGRITFSLVLGYGLIILISVAYCFIIGEEFIVFARANPSIIIMGGAILSGISFFGKK